MRALILVIFAAAVLPAQDAAEVVRKSAALEDHNADLSRMYTYLRRQEQRETDSAGKLKKTESDTYDITLLEGSSYRRHVSHNDQPLSAKEEKAEQEKLRKSIEERRKETPAAREQRIQDYARRQHKDREPYKEVPNAFNLTMAGEETLDGIPVYVIDASPKPGYKPKTNATQFFPKVKGRLWIAKQDYQLIKLDIESQDTISFGGFLIRMTKGSHVTIEATRVNNEVWLPKSAVLRGSVRIALIKVIRGEVLFTFTDYKKFQADSRVISVGQ
jgi:hypothetical protein